MLQFLLLPEFVPYYLKSLPKTPKDPEKATLYPRYPRALIVPRNTPEEKEIPLVPAKKVLESCIKVP